jgi:N-acetylglucosaminyl-diphospho-decaprenol L-rhamnosyltransferase
LTEGSPTIAVVVVTYNSARFLADLYASLPAGLGELNWHLTIADNSSPDDTVTVARELAREMGLPAQVVETGRNGGYAAGINAAVRAAPPHDAVLVLNPDIRLAPGCVPELVAVQRRHGAGITVPRIVRANGDFSPSLRREPTLLRAFGDAVFGANRMGRVGRMGEVITDRRQYAGETVADWAEGSILLITRECWDACGEWDESFFLYSEETEYALRARDRGFAMVYAPAAQARHLEGDSAASPPLWALLTLNRLRLYRKRHSLAGAGVYWALLLLREASRAALGSPTSRRATRHLLSVARLRETPGPASIQSTPARPNITASV